MASFTESMEEFTRTKNIVFERLENFYRNKRYKSPSHYGLSLSPERLNKEKGFFNEPIFSVLKYLWNIGTNCEGSIIQYIFDNLDLEYRTIKGGFGQPIIYICDFDKNYNPINEEHLMKLYEFIGRIKNLKLNKRRNGYQHNYNGKNLDTIMLSIIFLYITTRNPQIISWNSMMGQDSGVCRQHSKTPFLLRQNPIKIERLERERIESERLEYERLENERLERERLERERLEQENSKILEGNEELDNWEDLEF